MKLRWVVAQGAVAFGFFCLAGCGGSSSEPLIDETPINAVSILSLSVKDAPIDDASRVMVIFESIELKPNEGPSFDINFDSLQEIDLLNYQGMDSAALITNEIIPAGEYNWIRLKVNAERQTMDSFIEFADGSAYSLYVPSGSQSGLQLNQGFVAPANRPVSFTIDFDLRKSVHRPGNNSDDYFLRPSLRIIDNTLVGHIQGKVNPELLNGDDCGDIAAAYLFDAGQQPDDLGSASEPQANANVALDDNQENVFTIGFVTPGDYTLAITCDAGSDDPEVDDEIGFVAQADVTVVQGETSQVEF